MLREQAPLVEASLDLTPAWRFAEVAAKAAGATALLEEDNLAKLPRLLSDLLDGQNQPSSSAM